MREKHIGVLTSTRAEYGLLRPVIRALAEKPELRVSVLVTGAHLEPAFGHTVEEIEKDGFAIAVRVPILDGDDSPQGMSRAMARALEGFGGHFADYPYDMLVVLGDRYETLAVCCAATNARIPIAHLHGGETTQGAIDEAMRHAITKMSCLHFTSNAAHRQRVIQLGEHPDRVFDVGATGVENALTELLLSREELEEDLGFSLDGPYAVATFHPVTLDDGDVDTAFAELRAALDAFPHLRVIFTKSGADAGGRRLNELVDAYGAARDQVLAVSSLGTRRYLSAVKHAALVIGNSSSGIIEVPSFRVPTVNIGNRQRGRMQAASVINCPCERAAIEAAVEQALSEKFRASLANVINPYGNGHTSEKIAAILADALAAGPIDLQKPFYDVEGVGS